MPSTRHGGSAVDDSEPVEHSSTNQYSLSRAVHARRAEYTRPHRIRIKIGTWNVAACPGTDKDLASWFIDSQGAEPSLATLHLSESSFSDSTKQEDSDRQPVRDSLDATPNDGDTDEPSARQLGGDKIGLYVLGLQEIVNLNLVQQSLYSDPTSIAKWRDALEAALPKGYQLVACQQLVGLLLLIYASPEVAATVSNESTVSVGTGILGYMGNKGAVSSRILLGDTTRIVFSNCHLASGHDQASLDRRCWDYNKILTHTKFAAINHAGVEDDDEEPLGNEDFCFLFGDLNFRLDGLPGDDIRRLLTLHTRGEYDLTKRGVKTIGGEEGVIVLHNSSEDDPDGTKTPGMVSRETSFNEGPDDDDDENAELPDPDDFIPDPHDDPASLQATLDSLLPHDQLRRTIKERKALHQGWREGPITFLPTYKYDVGTVGLFDSSEKKRAPSWCDRILFRSREDLQRFESKIIEEAEAKKKDEDMQKRGIDQAADDESVLFDYDPSTEGTTSSETLTSEVTFDYDEYDEGADEDATVVAGESGNDSIHLDLYGSYQRVTSSDHKPLAAMFTLDYDAVVPELKAKIHAEVAKELDRAENEGRPVITVVVDNKGPSNEHPLDGSAGVDFGRVGFLQRQRRSLTLANTGRVPAAFCFVDKPGETDGEYKQPQWLHVSFARSTDINEQDQQDPLGKEITLEPGETVSVLLDIDTHDLTLVRALNADTAQLEEVLVLRVTEGRDHFIPIWATWQPSCFGRSLEELIRIPNGGIRALAQQEQLKGLIPSSFKVQKSSPAELYKLTEAIETLSERAIADENMLDDCKIPRDEPGWPFKGRSQNQGPGETHESHLMAIIEALEEDKSILDSLNAEVPTLERLETACEALVLFLRSMPDGIIPGSLWSKIEPALPDPGIPTTASGIETIKTVILDVLATSPYHNISFVFLTSMLCKVATDLLPLTNEDLEAIAMASSSGGGGRSTNAAITLASSAQKSASLAMGAARGLGFRRSSSSTGTASSGDAGGGQQPPQQQKSGPTNETAIARRLAWEKKAAEVLGLAICRPLQGGSSSGGGSVSAKEKKLLEEKVRMAIEVFFRKDGGGN